MSTRQISNRLMAAMFLAAAWTLYADNYTWSPTSGTASFQESANWSPSTGVPGADDNALFTGAGTYAVTFNGAVTNIGATVGTGSPGADVTFDLNGWLWRLTGTLGFGSYGTARFDGGTLQVSNAVSVTANQKLVLKGGSSQFDKVVTTSSGGAVEVNGGEHVFALPSNTEGYGLKLGSPPSNGVSLRITNGTANVGSRLLLAARATIDIEEGGSFLMPPSAFGMVMGGPATINVHTQATLISKGRRYYLGRNTGETTLNILGGAVSNTTAIMQIGTPYGNDSKGIINLVDGELYTSAPLYLGGDGLASRSSVGILHQTGGRLRVANELKLGSNPLVIGIYTQEAGVAVCDTLAAGCTAAGAEGRVHLAGGTLALINAPRLGDISGGTGCFHQTAGELMVSNNFNVGAAPNSYGHYRYSSGSAWIKNAINLGAAAGAIGQMTIDGGTSLTIKDSLVVGAVSGGTGELAIAGGNLVLNGGWEKDPSLQIGAVSNSVGRVFKTGGDAIMGWIHVGSGPWSHGEMLISGGTLSVTSKVALVVGGYSGRLNAFGRLEISGGTNHFADARIGHHATGILRISGGQTFITNAVNYVFSVGNLNNSTGRLELVGGVLTAQHVRGAGDYSETLFDGGVLRCCSTTISGDFFASFDQATLTDRGAVIDTDGNTRAISQCLSNETGYAGSFTKQGAGKLTLTSPSSAFTGRVSVESGELAVSGAIYLTGGVHIDEGAVLNLASATVPDAMTAAGTLSRIDGTLQLNTDCALTNGPGATLYGSGTISGSVVFAAGSEWAHAKDDYIGALQVTGTTVFEEGAMINLTGYTEEELTLGVPLVEAMGSDPIQTPGRIPVTLDGAEHPYWMAKVSGDGKTLTARLIRTGTMLQLR